MIEIINVSKKFRIWEDRSRDLKETAVNWIRGKKRSYRELWALREINLKITQGETVGFIGENGSGKSTLLKLLCGVYTPDEGKIITNGKISSLLELGVGFHPDLTGEENIYLNGAMLGFDSTEMSKRFDKIVSFSDIGDFVYSPIRTYSSGMLMRLGFSIAMCVDPDILLIDEVLAVGDEAFQKKCLRRLEEFKSASRTIVMVSHNLDLVKLFCERAVLLQNGRLITDGSPEAVIDKYHAILSSKEMATDTEKVRETVSWQQENEMKGLEEREGEKEGKEETEKNKEVPPQEPTYERYGTFEAEVLEVILKNEKEEETSLFISGEQMSIRVKIEFHEDINDPIVGFYLRRYEGNQPIDIYGMNSQWGNIGLGSYKRGDLTEVQFIQRIPIPEGKYYLVVAVAHEDGARFYDWHENVKKFSVKNRDQPWAGLVDLQSQIVVHRSEL